MKELSKKTFLIVFLLLSSFLIISVIMINLFAYRRESIFIEESLLRSLERDNVFSYDYNRLFVMDGSTYIVLVNSKDDYKVINNTGNNEINKLIPKILSIKTSKIKVGNLYFSNYSYNYRYLNWIVITDNSLVKDRLWLLLVKSLILCFIFELVIYYFSCKVSDWITKPVLESFDRQKEFIADASHELKTPLAVIMASADEIETNKKNIKYVDNIKHESDRMSSLIKSMLDLSKLENNNIDNYTDNNISKIVEKTCLVFDSIAYENDLKISTDIERDVIMKSSSEDIERLISIIIDNAIKHSYKKMTIDVILKKNKNSINIKIINRGDPIKDGDEDKIFDRFYRGDKSHNRDNNRYGLGLAIAKKIVENHNGKITAKSEDKMTCFDIVFNL